MYNVKLNDFELHEINLMLEIIETNLETFERTKMEAELREDTEEVSWIIERIDRDLNALTRFKIQFLNAKLDLKQIETTHQ